MKITKRRVFIGISLFLLISTGVGAYVWKQEHRLAIFEFYAFSLKNGDAYFIRTPDDKRILINGGSNSEVIRHISKILPFYTRRIDMVIVTDTEKKHAGGLVNVIERYSVGQVIIPQFTLENLKLATSTDQTYSEFLREVRSSKIPIRTIQKEERIELSLENPPSSALLQASPFSKGDAYNKVSVEILFPAPVDEFDYSKASGPELVMNISYGEMNILLAGNISKKIQKFISTDSSKPSINVLVVSHSATESNLDKSFIENLKSEYLIYTQSSSRSSAVIGFPYEKRFNVKEKSVKVISDGGEVKIKYF